MPIKLVQLTMQRTLLSNSCLKCLAMAELEHLVPFRLMKPHRPFQWLSQVICLLVPATLRDITIFLNVRFWNVVKNNFFIVSALPPQLSEPPSAREMITHTTGNGNIARPNQSSTPTMVCIHKMKICNVLLIYTL